MREDGGYVGQTIAVGRMDVQIGFVPGVVHVAVLSSI
jgi:hypothetical protein